MLLDYIAFQKEARTHAINATMGGNSGYFNLEVGGGVVGILR